MHHVPEAKVRPPAPPRPAVARTAVRRALEHGAATVLVRAPAGFGKTTAVAEWARGRGNTAWVTLDVGDRDPRRLWSAVLEALGRTPGGSAAAADLDPARTGDPLFPAALAAALDRCTDPPALVLDGLGRLDDGSGATEDRAEPSGLPDFLLERRPDVRVVLCSRGEPRLHLARLRLVDRLTEIGPELLRFDTAETDALLAGAVPNLEPAVAARLARATAGWPAGVRLAAQATVEARAAEGAFDFDGAHRLVTDYLVDEVLPDLTATEIAVLRKVVVVDPVPSGLAAALTGCAAAGRTLDELGRRTSLVRRDDAAGTGTPEHRIEPLLGSSLAAELSRLEPDEHARLEAVAARWYRATDPVTAALHAVRSGDASTAADVVATGGVSLLVRGRLTLLRQTLRVARAGTSSDPWLAALDALAAHRPAPAGAVSPAAPVPEWPARPSAELAVLRAAAEDWGALRPAPGRADLVVLPSAPAPRALGLVVRALGTLRAGGVPAAATTDEALGLADEHGFAPLAVQACAIAALAAAARSDLVGAHDAAVQTLARADRIALPHTHWTAAAAAVLGVVALLRCSPGEALRWTALARTGAPRGPVDLEFGLDLVESAARFDLADGAGLRAAALDVLCGVRQGLGGQPVDLRTASLAALVEHRAALSLGRRTAARAVLGWLRDRVGETPETVLLHGWTELAAGRGDGARAAARRARSGAVGEPALGGLTEVECLLLEAAAAVARGERQTTRGALDAALGRAEALGTVRPFAVAGPRVREFVTRLYGGRADTGSFAADVLVAVAQDCDGDHRLSDRERDVLELLPSLLSLAEIGGDLSVSLNTVKTHVRSIYGKLGVSNRRAAVLAGYERGLISPARALTVHG